MIVHIIYLSYSIPPAILHSPQKALFKCPALVDNCNQFYLKLCIIELSSVHVLYIIKSYNNYTPNANMADHSGGARDKSHESEASWALMFCFDNVAPEKACFVVNLVCFISLWLRVAVFLNAARKDINLPPFAS